MDKKFLSEVINEHKEEIIGTNGVDSEQSSDNLILITAGVGAGKNTWVQKELVKELKDDETILFITSRKMIQEQTLKSHAFCDNFKMCIENHYHFTTTHQKLINMIVNQNDIYENIKKVEKLNFKYIVIDEVHSLIADSGFADSTYYLSMLINYFLANNKKIICMSATTHSLLLYFKRFGEYKHFDFSNECYNVKPKSVEIITQEKAIQLLSQANANNKMLYMANSATDICKRFAPSLIKEYKIPKENIGILISDTKKEALNPKANINIKKMLKNMNSLNDYIVENEAFPEDINIVLSTSKVREGINLADSNIKAMFCESHNPIDIVQFSGRYRKSIEKYYIIDNSHNQAKEQDIFTMNLEYDFLSNICLENINLYHSILFYRATNYINRFLEVYLKSHHTDIDKVNISMNFTNAVINMDNLMNPTSKNKKVVTISNFTSNKNYIKSSKNRYTINGFAYIQELNDFKDFITTKFPLLRYNPILNKYEIYSESYYYKLESFESYKNYQLDSEKFIKDTLQINSVLKDLPKFNKKDNKKYVKKEIMKLLHRNNWLNIRLAKDTQSVILDEIFSNILNKRYQQLGRLLSYYEITFEKPGANNKNYILITEQFFN